MHATLERVGVGLHGPPRALALASSAPTRSSVPGEKGPTAGHPAAAAVGEPAKSIARDRRPVGSSFLLE
jgi:hypothetical protein